MEAIDSDPIEAVSSIGVSKWQLVRYVILPESASHLLGHACTCLIIMFGRLAYLDLWEQVESDFTL